MVSRNSADKEERKMHVGTCKWFNVLKGYGFITPDDGGEDVFVHQSELNMDGFRSLDAGERVRFIIRKRPEGNEATAVTAIEPGCKLKGSSIRPLGKIKPNLIRCFKCGHYGNHTAAKCKSEVGADKACYGCHATDHLIASCPHKKRSTVKKEARKKEDEVETVGSTAEEGDLKADIVEKKERGLNEENETKEDETKQTKDEDDAENWSAC